MFVVFGVFFLLLCFFLRIRWIQHTSPQLPISAYFENSVFLFIVFQQSTVFSDRVMCSQRCKTALLACQVIQEHLLADGGFAYVCGREETAGIWNCWEWKPKTLMGLRIRRGIEKHGPATRIFQRSNQSVFTFVCICVILCLYMPMISRFYKFWLRWSPFGGVSSPPSPPPQPSSPSSSSPSS